MFRREAIRLAVCMVLGFAAAVLIVVIYGFTPWLLLIAPFYLTGTVYALLRIVAAISGAIRAGSRLWLTAIITRSLVGFVIGIIIMLFGCVFVLSFGWLIGVATACTRLAEARNIDISL